MAGGEKAGGVKGTRVKRGRGGEGKGKESKKRGGGRGRRERQRRQGARRKDEGTGKIIERGEGQEGGGRREERARQQIATGERDQGTKIPGRKADTGEHTNTGKVQGAPGLAPGCGLEPSEPKRSACLSHTPGTSGGPPSNSPACSPRRERRRVFRALFPACDVSPRIVRPSRPGLRPGDNGDRSLRVGARSALDRTGPRKPVHNPGTLPPLG